MSYSKVSVSPFFNFLNVEGFKVLVFKVLGASWIQVFGLGTATSAVFLFHRQAAHHHSPWN